MKITTIQLGGLTFQCNGVYTQGRPAVMYGPAPQPPEPPEYYVEEMFLVPTGGARAPAGSVDLYPAFEALGQEAIDKIDEAFYEALSGEDHDDR